MVVPADPARPADNPGFPAGTGTRLRFLVAAEDTIIVMETPAVPSGVGMTAIGVARVRAAETLRPDRLFADPLAAEFVAAAGWPPVTEESVDEERDVTPRWRALLRSIIVRTRFLDEYMRDAVEAGCRQVALLGAGLDARAFRLDWPPGTRLFELDTKEMLDFKESVVRAAGAQPGCERIAVAGDLLDDFPSALTKAGFDPDQRTAWIAEGLLVYLTAGQNEELLRRVGELSAPASRLALTVTSQSRLDQLRADRPADAAPSVVDMWQSGAPADPVAWLAGHGWIAEASDPTELAAAYGRPGLFDGLDVHPGKRGLISAIRG